eukprot:1979271-Rhodomonas_salina.1
MGERSVSICSFPGRRMTRVSCWHRIVHAEHKSVPPGRCTTLTPNPMTTPWSRKRLRVIEQRRSSIVDAERSLTGSLSDSPEGSCPLSAALRAGVSFCWERSGHAGVGAVNVCPHAHWNHHARCQHRASHSAQNHRRRSLEMFSRR